MSPDPHPEPAARSPAVHLDQPGARRGLGGPPPRKGFFTDTSICIGCKACEVACKEWNGLPDDGFELLGSSYDNTGALGANTWRHVAFIEQRKPATVDLGMPRSAARARRRRRADRLPLADGLQRLQALHERGLPRRLPDGRAVPDRVRHRRRPGRHLQRLRLLRGRLPVRGDRPPDRTAPRGTSTQASRRSARSATTASATVQTPACAQACPTQSIQFGDVDELRERARTRVDDVARAGRDGRPAVRRGPRRRGRRGGCVLPAARRAGGVRAAAGPDRHHRRPAADVEAPRRSRPRAGLLVDRGRRRFRRRAGDDARREPRVERAHTGGPQLPGAGRRRVGGRAAARSRWSRTRTFTSYYGRPVVKAAPWEADIPAYLFAGGLAGGSSLLAAGADLTGRPHLRRAGRIAALGALSASMLALVHDLGRPERF